MELIRQAFEEHWGQGITSADFVKGQAVETYTKTSLAVF